MGVKGNFGADGTLKSIGITCAFCHSTVDNSFAPGIGKRLDGWPNRDLNVGAIISLTDNAQPIANMLHVDEPTLRNVLGDGVLENFQLFFLWMERLFVLMVKLQLT